MKRIIALFLATSMLLTGCAETKEQISSFEEESSGVVSESHEDTEKELIYEQNEIDVNQFDGLDDVDLLQYVEDNIYAELVNTLDPNLFYVQEVSSVYISKEYLEEVAYNSQSNIFFGYSLAELNETFNDTKYVFTLGENDETTVQELVVLEDNVYDEVITKVAIGAGVILVCVTVAIITKNPAASATAGKTVKMIFTASSMGAKAGTSFALKSAAFGGAAATIVEGYRTNDVDKALEAGLIGASDGFMCGAIFGSAKGIANGIKIVGNSRFFPNNTPQAIKYPGGIEFTKGADGNVYPRFEKWAKATATFDTPTIDKALNHTGLSGNYYWDAKLANAQCGFKNTPSGYVWHHVEDMKTMILVPQDLHSVAMGGVPHTGGASLIRNLLGL